MEETAEGPHVNFVVEWVFSKHLWADVDRRTNFGNVQLTPLHSPRNSHVTDLNTVILHQQNILGFDISVDNFLGMQICQPLCYLLSSRPNFVLRYKLIVLFVPRDMVLQVTFFRIFH